MAALPLSPSTPCQLSSTHSKNGLFKFSPTKDQIIIMPTKRFKTVGWNRRMKVMVTCQAATTTTIPTDNVSDIQRRKLLKLLLFGTLALPAAAIFLPVHTPGGGIFAKDEVGDYISASEWLKTHGPGDRTLTLGFKGDPTYLMVENNKTLATYGINAVCTHLGCIVPWNTVEKKFVCPCHGSQFNSEGTVIKGPASRSLELANVDIEDDKVVFAPWTDTNFRTGDVPWWS